LQHRIPQKQKKEKDVKILQAANLKVVLLTKENKI
jgi:hypothetical protein